MPRAMRAMTATPPTTPPTMGPMLVDDFCPPLALVPLLLLPLLVPLLVPLEALLLPDDEAPLADLVVEDSSPSLLV